MIFCYTNWYRYEHFRGIPALTAVPASIAISSAVRTAEFSSPTETALIRSTQVSRFPVYYPPRLISGSTSDVSLVDYLLTWHCTLLSAAKELPHSWTCWLAHSIIIHTTRPVNGGGGVTQSALIKRWCKGAVEEGGGIKSVLNGMCQFYCSARVVVEG